MPYPVAGSILNVSRQVVRRSVSNAPKRWKSSTPVEKTNLREGSQKLSQKTIWPSSFRAFVREGEPLITRPLPFVGSFKIDFGTAMMNIGAITSLTGFMMTDVLLLRTLSIFGSLCGIIYNITRIPRQWNAVAWGFVFISVNLTRTVQLMLERREIQFSVEEAQVYYRKFQPHGVEPRIFKQLMEMATWKTVEPGQDVVTKGKPLKHVHILVDGEASAYDGEGGERLYGYSSEDNGCIIGATAIVDPTIIGRTYPNQIVADRKVRVLSFDTRKLRAFFKNSENGALVEGAMLHLIYVDLIENLRRHRKERKESDGSIVTAMSETLGGLKEMLASTCSDGTITTAERRQIREYLERHKISDSQFKALLKSEVGWTESEWKDGAKHDIIARGRAQ